MDTAKQTPLLDLLNSTPIDGVAQYTWPNGESQNIPYGRQSYEAVERIRELEQQLSDWRGFADDAADTIQQQAERIMELEAELSKFQESSFNPDWSLLEAARESLREHMALLKDNQQQLAEVVEYARKLSDALHEILEDTLNAVAFDATSLPLPKAMQENKNVPDAG